MKGTVTEADISKLVEDSDKLKDLLQKPSKITLLSDKDNVAFRIAGKNDVVAKVGYTGWGKYEYEALKLLYSKNYNVPEPIVYIPLKKKLENDWGFGNIRRELGVLFFSLIEGKNLKQDHTKINISKGLNFLKKLHEDKSLTAGNIKDYQKFEVERGLNYTKKLFHGEISKFIENMIIKYQDYEIKYCFIHGGPRLEHFIVKDDKIWMIDFEGACFGDRFKDLGIFFTEILPQNYKEEELIEAYFERKLTDNEKARLAFFKLRTLLVKMYFEPSPEVLELIKRLVKYS